MRPVYFFAFMLLAFCARSQNLSFDSLVRQGIALHDHADYAAAIARYREALLVVPGSPLVNYEMAYSFQASRQYDSAMLYAEKVIASGDPDLALQGMIVKGSILDEMGKTRQSVRYYKKILKTYPDHYLILYNYAVSCVRTGDRLEAKDALLRGMRARVNHPGTHLKLAYLNIQDRARAQAVFGLYFFLMLENNSERSADALATLCEILYGTAEFGSIGDQKSPEAIVLFPHKDPYVQAAELWLASLRARHASGDTTELPEQRFIRDTETLFELMTEIRSREDKQPDESWEPAFEIYVPFFSQLKKANHTPAFCYHILQSTGRDEVARWKTENKAQLEFFYLWADSN